jgi:hypothetical protein
MHTQYHPRAQARLEEALGDQQEITHRRVGSSCLGSFFVHFRRHRTHTPPRRFPRVHNGHASCLRCKLPPAAAEEGARGLLRPRPDSSPGRLQDVNPIPRRLDVAAAAAASCLRIHNCFAETACLVRTACARTHDMARDISHLTVPHLTLTFHGWHACSAGGAVAACNAGHGAHIPGLPHDNGVPPIRPHTAARTGTARSAPDYGTDRASGETNRPLHHQDHAHQNLHQSLHRSAAAPAALERLALGPVADRGSWSINKSRTATGLSRQGHTIATPNVKPQGTITRNRLHTSSRTCCAGLSFLALGAPGIFGTIGGA